MKKLILLPYRECDKRFKLKEYYIVETRKLENGDLVLTLPADIVRAYHLQKGDAAIFEIVDKNGFSVRFVKKGRYSFVEQI